MLVSLTIFFLLFREPLEQYQLAAKLARTKLKNVGESSDEEFCDESAEFRDAQVRIRGWREDGVKIKQVNPYAKRKITKNFDNLVEGKHELEDLPKYEELPKFVELTNKEDVDNSKRIKNKSILVEEKLPKFEVLPKYEKLPEEELNSRSGSKNSELVEGKYEP